MGMVFRIHKRWCNRTRSSAHAGWTSQIKQYMSLEDFGEEWVWIDLQGVISIDKVMLYPRQDNGGCFPMDYYIEVSTDNENFEKVAEVTGDDRSREGIKEPAILTFEPVDARYVRLVVTKPFEVPAGNDGYLVQLAEFEIYAAPSS